MIGPNIQQEWSFAKEAGMEYHLVFQPVLQRAADIWRNGRRSGIHDK
jgi:hypothetical protein